VFSVKTDGPARDTIQGNNEGDMSRAGTPHAMVNTAKLSIFQGRAMNLDALSRPGTPRSIARLTVIKTAQDDFESASQIATSNALAKLSVITKGNTDAENIKRVGTPSGRRNPTPSVQMGDNDAVIGAVHKANNFSGIMNTARVTALKAWVANGQTSGRRDSSVVNNRDTENLVLDVNESDVNDNDVNDHDVNDNDVNDNDAGNHVISVDEDDADDHDTDVNEDDENDDDNRNHVNDANENEMMPNAEAQDNLNGGHEADDDSGYDNSTEGQRPRHHRPHQRPSKSRPKGRRRRRTAAEIQEKKREHEERQEEFRTKHTRIMNWLDDCIENLQDENGGESSTERPTLQPEFEMRI